jgi:hypothetical protein
MIVDGIREAIVIYDFYTQKSGNVRTLHVNLHVGIRIVSANSVDILNKRPVVLAYLQYFFPKLKEFKSTQNDLMAYMQKNDDGKTVILPVKRKKKDSVIYTTK